MVVPITRLLPLASLLVAAAASSLVPFGVLHQQRQAPRQQALGTGGVSTTNFANYNERRSATQPDEMFKNDLTDTRSSSATEKAEASPWRALAPPPANRMALLKHKADVLLSGTWGQFIAGGWWGGGIVADGKLSKGPLMEEEHPEEPSVVEVEANNASLTRPSTADLTSDANASTMLARAEEAQQDTSLGEMLANRTGNVSRGFGKWLRPIRHGQARVVYAGAPNLIETNESLGRQVQNQPRPEVEAGSDGNFELKAAGFAANWLMPLSAKLASARATLAERLEGGRSEAATLFRTNQSHSNMESGQWGEMYIGGKRSDLKQTTADVRLQQHARSYRPQVTEDKKATGNIKEPDHPQWPAEPTPATNEFGLGHGARHHLPGNQGQLQRAGWRRGDNDNGRRQHLAVPPELAASVDEAVGVRHQYGNERNGHHEAAANGHSLDTPEERQGKLDCLRLCSAAAGGKMARKCPCT